MSTAVKSFLSQRIMNEKIYIWLYASFSNKHNNILNMFWAFLFLSNLIMAELIFSGTHDYS